MPTYRIEVALMRELDDPAGDALRAQVREDLNLEIGAVRTIDVFTLQGEFTQAELERVRVDLFTDPIIEHSALNKSLASDYSCVIEVGFLPGVTDNAGRCAKEGVEDSIGRSLAAGEAVYKSTLYVFQDTSLEQAKIIASSLLANELIEQFVIKTPEEMEQLGGSCLLSLPRVVEYDVPAVESIDLNLSDDALQQMSRDRMFALELSEMQVIRDYYNRPDVQEHRRSLGMPENPTDIEMEILAQTWSEHCKHKIFDAIIHLEEADGSKRVIDSVFKSYIKRLTEEVGQKVPWLVSVFHDNAGIIQFDENHLFALKAETHNSPSALDPYGGAMTGIVGVNRDVLGAGLGFKCIFNTDVLCVASPFHDEEIPPRLLHPRRILRGAHAGVRDGGNQSGVPNVNGALVFHERFLGKPLVFCGTGGISPAYIQGKPAQDKAALPGDLIVMTGGRIGKDGIHGATFSSEALHEGSPATAVQIGDPITQKKMADFLMEARDAGLYSCITDNGAGGLSSSVGEMAEKPGGAAIHLERAPLKYAGLAPWEIFVSEAQERMTLAVPPNQLPAFLKLAKARGVEASVLGEFNNSGYLDCYYEGKRVASLDMDFLHDGLPRMELEARLDPVPVVEEVTLPDTAGDLTEDLVGLLGSLNICSKESFVRMLDHEVLGQSVLKQFQGVNHDGPGDAAVIRPLPDSYRGIAVACGIAPKFADLDAWAMTACAVDEGVRNLVAVGASMGTIAGLDNFCWPDPVQSEGTPDGKHKLAQLVQSCEALYDICLAYDIPLISGKDSMKNDYRIGDTKISIPPTLLFTAAAILEDVRQVVSMDAKRAGDKVYVLGDTFNELGGSEYFNLKGIEGGTAPTVTPDKARRLYEALHKAITQGLVASCHDCSDGGLAVALAETAFAGDLGMKLSLDSMAVEDSVVALFSESQSRFVVTVAPDQAAAFEEVLAGNACYSLGEVTEEAHFEVTCPDGRKISAALETLRNAWKQTLNW